MITLDIKIELAELEKKLEEEMKSFKLVIGDEKCIEVSRLLKKLKQTTTRADRVRIIGSILFEIS